jgi:hypothetical protein
VRDLLFSRYCDTLDFKIGLRAIPLDVQGVEEKKEAEKCFCKGNKHTKIILKCCFLGFKGGNQFVDFWFLWGSWNITLMKSE